MPHSLPAGEESHPSIYTVLPVAVTFILLPLAELGHLNTSLTQETLTAVFGVTASNRNP